MIVADTSALVAALRNEPDGYACRAIIEAGNQILISACTVVEAMIVVTRRGFDHQMTDIIKLMEIVPVTRERVDQIVAAYGRWGKGVHPASLNFGDCFSYAAAQEFDCTLLYMGNDFSRTDIRSARRNPAT